MTLCETCIHYQGGRGVQKGVSLCGKGLRPTYRFPESITEPHGYVSARKNCHATEIPVPKLKRKKRVRVTRRKAKL